MTIIGGQQAQANEFGDFGNFTRSAIVAVGTASVLLLSANTRQVFVITNTSPGTQKITVNLGFNPAVAGAGIVLLPGQSYVESNSEGFVTFSGCITGISDAASGQVSISER